MNVETHTFITRDGMHMGRVMWRDNDGDEHTQWTIPHADIATLYDTLGTWVAGIHIDNGFDKKANEFAIASLADV